MNKFLKNDCSKCRDGGFSIVEKLTMINGSIKTCDICKKKYKGTEPWKFFFQVAIGLIPILLVLSVIFNGLSIGIALFIVGFLIVSVFLAFRMPIEEIEFRSKTDTIDENKTKKN